MAVLPPRVGARLEQAHDGLHEAVPGAEHERVVALLVREVRPSATREEQLDAADVAGRSRVRACRQERGRAVGAWRSMVAPLSSSEVITSRRPVMAAIISVVTPSSRRQSGSTPSATSLRM